MDSLDLGLQLVVRQEARFNAIRFRFLPRTGLNRFSVPVRVWCVTVYSPTRGAESTGIPLNGKSYHGFYKPGVP